MIITYILIIFSNCTIKYSIDIFTLFSYCIIMPTPRAPQQCGINVTDEIYKTKNYFGWYIYVITYTGTGNCLYINIKKSFKGCSGFRTTIFST